MPGTATLTGAVSLREPAEIPAGSVLTVTVEDTSRADAPAVPLAQTQIDLTGQRAPIPFALPYPTAALDQRAVYTARARVTMGDRLLFTTTESNRVDVFNPAPADLVLFHPDRGWKVEAGKLPGKAQNSPFDGRALEGRVMATIKAGRKVFG